VIAFCHTQRTGFLSIGRPSYTKRGSAYCITHSGGLDFHEKYCSSMSRRNKQKQEIRPPARPLPPEPAVGVESQTRPRRDLFKPLFEKACDVAKSALQVARAISPIALFVYGKHLKHEQLKESATKVVSLSWKNEFHKEVVRMRIQEKARAEGASAVVLLTPGPGGPREGTFLISGAMPDMVADASVAYTLDRETGTLLLSEMVWGDQPVPNFFLEGLFPLSDTPATL
jgi:hypothetical protein